MRSNGAAARAKTNSLERALALMELVDRAPGGLTNGDICRRLGIPTSTCSWITGKLEQSGYLHRDPNTRCFKIGLAAVALAHGALRELGFRSVAESVLYRLASETKLSAGIGVLERGCVLVVDRVESLAFLEAAQAKSRRRTRERTREQRDIGRQIPAHTTALGKILLASLPERELAQFLETHTLTRSTEKTIVSKSKLLKELESVRRRGYAMADEELYPGVRALAAPIFDSLKMVRAALSLNGDLNSASWDDTASLVAKLEGAANEISAGLTALGQTASRHASLISSIY